jgi:hypothetical protein
LASVKLAKQTGMLCALQSFHSDLFCSPLVIWELLYKSLTKLHLCGDGIDPDITWWPTAVMAAAKLTSLRSLILETSRTVFMPGAYLSSISSLSQLILLQAIGMDPEDAFPYLALLPHSLAALRWSWIDRRTFMIVPST